MNKYFVVIPVYNEDSHIKKLIADVQKYTKNIIVVNDGSTDDTLKKVKGLKPKVILISMKKNEGKGAAMKKGAKLAWKLKADGIVFLDGDNQHDPRHLTEFFDYLKNGTDIIIGIRKIKAKIPIIRRLGNECFIFLMRWLFNVEIEDVICGYRAFSKKGYKKIMWQSNDYGVEVEMMTLIGRKRLPYKTVVVDTIYHDKYKGFSMWDGIKILLKLPYWRLRKI